MTLRTQIRKTPLLVGVRHILDVEDQDWLLREDVHRGLRVLEEEDKVFDCLVRPPTLKHVATIGKNIMHLIPGTCIMHIMQILWLILRYNVKWSGV